MARITLPVIAIAVAFSALPGALAGPACTNKQWNSVDECIQKCNNKWGWAGHIMGSDPWGVVVKPASGTDDPKKAVETACKAKFSGSHSTSAASTTKSSTSTSVTPIINAQSAPPTDPTTSTEKISTSTSSTASRITTVRTTSTPSTTSTTASTTSSTSRGLATIANTTFSKAEGNTALAEETSKSLPPKSTISQEPETTSTPPPKTITKAPPPPKTTSTPPPKTTSVDTGDDDDNKGDNNGGNNNGNNGGNNNGNNGGGNNGSNNGGGNGGSNNGGSSSGGGSVSAADQQRYLNAHNSVRAQHGAGALSWADDLEAAAQKWANNCVFKHSGGTLGPFGENLAAGTGNSYTIETAVKSWTDEVSDFHANNPQPSHFTQVVWKASTQVGCAVADCDGIFDSSFGKAHFHVCEYRSQGNVIGQFAQNVQA